ncbi:MAG TPA: thiamine pyrophosphate-dependent dehydrogenase E1 component subunit alpha [Phycisphaerae bacterium]|nr:thiamine pyrophosphate-dependent dehydrogenase E1 component subunit alpha [Phycisphaerae bacterium]
MLERIYRSLQLIRRVEEEVARVYPSDKIMSPVHLSIGQEAVSVGVCDALRPDDIAFGTYRSHALYLAKGGNLKGMIAELYGKAAGCAKGKAGSMHLIDIPAGVMGASAVVGTTIPHAAGYAMAVKARKGDQLVVCFLGDGATEEGVFSETLNFAVIKQLPVLFVCENNSYAIHSTLAVRQGKTDICQRVRSHGMPAERIDDMDVLNIRDFTEKAAGKIRGEKGSGPMFLECMCYRWMEHVGPNHDYHLGYRNRSEAESWMKNDQVKIVGEKLNPDVRKRIDAEVEAEVRAAFEFAEKAPFPDERELYTDMFKEG